MAASYYKDNEDNKDLAAIRIKRMKEDLEKRRKDKLKIDLETKKHFLTSTQSMILAKNATLQQKSQLLRRYQSEVRAIEQKEKSFKSEEERMSLLKKDVGELNKKEDDDEQALAALEDERKSLQQKEKALEQKIDALKNEIQSLTVKKHTDESALKSNSPNSSRRLEFEKQQRNKEIQSIQREITKFNQDLVQLSGDKSKLEAEIKRLEAEIR